MVACWGGDTTTCRLQPARTTAAKNGITRTRMDDSPFESVVTGCPPATKSAIHFSKRRLANPALEREQSLDRVPGAGRDVLSKTSFEDLHRFGSAETLIRSDDAQHFAPRRCNDAHILMKRRLFGAALRPGCLLVAEQRDP